MTFGELVTYYGQTSAGLGAVIKRQEINSLFPDLDTFAEKLLVYKVEKHHQVSNLRKVAMYIALFLREKTYKEHGIDLPERVKVIARKRKLRRHRVYGVGYLHDDGTYHWFDV